jgi:L-rhamnose mutarotase
MRRTPVQTFGLTICLKDDPALIESYKDYHLRVWPEVTARLREVGINEMRIFLRGTRMFMYIETTDEFDPVKDWGRIQDDPKSKEWNVLMGNLQEPAPEAGPGEWWARMELVFDMSWPQHRPPA